jgi:hypothetical protein
LPTIRKIAAAGRTIYALDENGNVWKYNRCSGFWEMPGEGRALIPRAIILEQELAEERRYEWMNYPDGRPDEKSSEDSSSDDE